MLRARKSKMKNIKVDDKLWKQLKIMQIKSGAKTMSELIGKLVEKREKE